MSVPRPAAAGWGACSRRRGRHAAARRPGHGSGCCRAVAGLLACAGRSLPALSGSEPPLRARDRGHPPCLPAAETGPRRRTARRCPTRPRDRSPRLADGPARCPRRLLHGWRRPFCRRLSAARPDVRRGPAVGRRLVARHGCGGLHPQKSYAGAGFGRSAASGERQPFSTARSCSQWTSEWGDGRIGGGCGVEREIVGPGPAGAEASRPSPELGTGPSPFSVCRRGVGHR